MDEPPAPPPPPPNDDKSALFPFDIVNTFDTELKDTVWESDSDVKNPNPAIW